MQETPAMKLDRAQRVLDQALINLAQVRKEVALEERSEWREAPLLEPEDEFESHTGDGWHTVTKVSHHPSGTVVVSTKGSKAPYVMLPTHVVRVARSEA